MEHLRLEEAIKKYPIDQKIQENAAELLQIERTRQQIKFVVLDDDPTGVQTVHGVHVYTNWNYDNILEGFLEENNLFYILTNSRAFTEDRTIEVHREIARNIMRAAKDSGKKFVLISRGDSTLRGHYPLETEILKEELEQGMSMTIDGEFLIPFFKAGGRMTIDDVHYIAQGENLIPVAETEFAKDKTFGYSKSNLTQYIEEKTEGRFRAQDVTSIGLSQLRGGDWDGIEKELKDVKDFHKVIVNGMESMDLESFCIPLLRTIQQGKNFLFRTAADFVKVLAGIGNQPLLNKQDMILEDNRHGGMIVIGSHTAKTTEQLMELITLADLEIIEFDSDLVLENRLSEEVERVSKEASRLIGEGKTVITHTKRKLLSLDHDTKEMALLRSVKISEAVAQCVNRLTVAPNFVVAKGGITSSDVGVIGLQMKKGYVLGQVKPGIPVLSTDEESKFPGIPYVIFPGNVGEKDTLKEVVRELSSK